MLSRLAEHVYWMARYLERAENTARLISTGTHLALDQPHAVRIDWRALIEVLGGPEAAAHCDPDLTPERAAMVQLIPASEHPSSIHAAIARARENARTVRDLLPDELRERINQLYFHSHRGAGAAVERAHRFDYLRGVVEYAQGISGVIEGTLSRGPTYQFLMLGRHLERADMTTRTIDVRAATLPKDEDDHPPTWDDAVWMNMLRYLGGYSQFRQQRGPGIQGPAVVDFLLRDERFPRSVRFCTQRMERALEELPHPEAPCRLLAEAERRASAEVTAPLDAEALHRRLDALQVDLSRVHESLGETYFSDG